MTEYLLERMTAAGVNRVCFVISPDKTDIVRYFGARTGDAPDLLCGTAEPGWLVRRALHRIAFRRS